jgi:hypothetical protein
MMQPREFTSAGFAKVSSAPRPDVPERFLHRDVRSQADARTGAASENRKRMVRLVDLPSSSLSVIIGRLTPGEETRTHRYNYETIIHVLEGAGRSRIEGRDVSGRQAARSMCRSGHGADTTIPVMRSPHCRSPVRMLRCS